MSIQINHLISAPKNILSNHILFVDEKFSLESLSNSISKNDLLYIKELLKIRDLKKDILFFNINSKKTIYLVSIKKNPKESEVEN